MWKRWRTTALAASTRGGGEYVYSVQRAVDPYAHAFELDEFYINMSGGIRCFRVHQVCKGSQAMIMLTSYLLSCSRVSAESGLSTAEPTSKRSSRRFKGAFIKL